MIDIATYCSAMIRDSLRFALPPLSVSRPAADEKFDLLRLEAAAATVQQANGGKLLIAAYGSLPSNPEVGLCSPLRAVIPGYRKSLCVSVTTHRGTVQRPGLVAGILPDRRDAAMALVFEAEPLREESLLLRLARRELLGKPYEPKPLSVRLDDGTERLALGFTAAVDNPGVRTLSPRVAAGIVAKACGCAGSNADYLHLTLQFERAHFGFATPELVRIESLLAHPDPAAVGATRPPALHRFGTLSASALAA